VARPSHEAVFSVEVIPHDRKGRVANVDARASQAQHAQYSGFGDARQLPSPRRSSLCDSRRKARVRRIVEKSCSQWEDRHDPPPLRRPAASAAMRLITRDTDVFIASYPKSGNTWVRFIIANLIQPQQAITFRNIDEVVPDVHKLRGDLDRFRSPRTIKSHAPDFGTFPRYIYVYRDGRDALASWYRYVTDKGRFHGTFSEFLRTRGRDTFAGHWHEHVARAALHAVSHPGRALFVSYESLLMSTRNCVHDIVAFLPLEVGDDEIDAAIAKTDLASLREMEKKFGPETPGKLIEFFREGRSGAWRDVFAEDDVEYFTGMAGETLRLLGYAL